jgi:hypothetical protein
VKDATDNSRGVLPPPPPPHAVKNNNTGIDKKLLLLKDTKTPKITYAINIYLGFE